MILTVIAQEHICPRLTRLFLKRCTIWDNWEKSEQKQLESYRQQEMFREPQPLPQGANLLLWTYLIKPDGTKKAQCVCNGNPNIQGSATLNHTYTTALDQAGARIFWALAALHDHVVVGADTTNAFAEAPVPKLLLNVTIDALFQYWWVNVLRCPPITPGHVLLVRHALQGHPKLP